MIILHDTIDCYIRLLRNEKRKKMYNETLITGLNLC